MGYYYMNSNIQEDSGQHEVHTNGCEHPPEEENRIPIGNFNNCHEAIAVARTRWPHLSIDGCYWCAEPCHTG